MAALSLASHLLNDPDDGPAFASTAAAHLEPAGLVMAKVLPEGYDPTAGLGKVQRMGDAFVELLWAEVSDGIMAAEVRYGADDQEWRQAFRAKLLDQPAIERLLARAGLAFAGWLDSPGWFKARAR